MPRAAASRQTGAAPYASSTMWLCASTFALLFVFLLERHGGYRPCVSLLAIRETERILRVTLQAFAIALMAAYFLKMTPSRLALGLVLTLVPLFVTLEKWEIHQPAAAAAQQRLWHATRHHSGHRWRGPTDLHGIGPLAQVWRRACRLRTRKTLQVPRRRFSSVPITANIPRRCFPDRCVRRSSGTSTLRCW